MLSELNDQDRAERDAIVADIDVAFKGVTRGPDGISWNECDALDRYQPPRVCAAARGSDKDLQWPELVDDRSWDRFPGIGGFAFIYNEGFRYYLPPTMIRFLHGDVSEWYPGHLLHAIDRLVEPPELPHWGESKLRSIARFISFIAHHDPELQHFPDDPNPWANAIAQRWHVYLPK